MAYRTFIQKILKEKSLQYQLELDHQKEIALQFTLVQENERKRIAEALHDDVGSKLNILSLWVNNEDTWNNKKSKKIISQQVPELIEATRTISHSLYPVNLEKFGLLHTLDALMANITDSLSIQLILKYDYQPRAISFELQLYRIIQEFLSNVIKHAKATSMIIYIRDTKDVVTLILSDNGIGFDNVNKAKMLTPYYTTKTKGTGLGLSIVTKIINDHNSTIIFNSIKDGAQVEITIPKYYD